MSEDLREVLRRYEEMEKRNRGEWKKEEESYVPPYRDSRWKRVLAIRKQRQKRQENEEPERERTPASSLDYL